MPGLRGAFFCLGGGTAGLRAVSRGDDRKKRPGYCLVHTQVGFFAHLRINSDLGIHGGTPRSVFSAGYPCPQSEGLRAQEGGADEAANPVVGQVAGELHVLHTLDEPTRGIDVGAHAEIIRLIETLCADGLALLVISSELEELVGYADRVIIMRDRKQVAEIPLAELSVPAIMNAIAA